MLAVVLLCLAPGVARAGTYEVWTCAGPGWEPIPADGWTAEGGASFSNPVNACASGGGLYAGLNGDRDHPVGTSLSWHFKAPANTKIASYQIWRTADVDTNLPNETPLYTMTRQANVYDAAHVVEQCRADECGSLGTNADRANRANLVGDANLADVRDVWLNASCGGAGGSTCQAAAGSEPDTSNFRMYRGAFVLQDDSDPVFTSPPAGSLTAPGTLAGVYGVSFSATDAGGGLYEAVIEVDGNDEAAQSLGCSVPFTATVPCKLTASGTVSLDTAGLADGQHSVRVLLRDATRSNAAAFGPFTITTSNAPTSCAATVSPALKVTTKGRTIANGARMNVHGTLAGARAGTQVWVLSRVARAGAPTRVIRTPVTTDARGRFTYRVPAGPSRTLHFGIRGTGDPQYQCSGALAIRVRARAVLTARPAVVRAGRSLRLTGRLRGGYVPSRGKLVELQAFDDGRWRSVRTVRTNARGAFRYTYRFSRGAARKRYPFRAVVRAESGYPFALGTSSRVNVRVR